MADDKSGSKAGNGGKSKQAAAAEKPKSSESSTHRSSQRTQQPTSEQYVAALQKLADEGDPFAQQFLNNYMMGQEALKQLRQMQPQPNTPQTPQQWLQQQALRGTGVGFDPNYGAFIQGSNQQLALNAQLMGLYAHGQSLAALGAVYSPFMPQTPFSYRQRFGLQNTQPVLVQTPNGPMLSFVNPDNMYDISSLLGDLGKQVGASLEEAHEEAEEEVPDNLKGTAAGKLYKKFGDLADKLEDEDIEAYLSALNAMDELKERGKITEDITDTYKELAERLKEEKEEEKEEKQEEAYEANFDEAKKVLGKFDGFGAFDRVKTIKLEEGDKEETYKVRRGPDGKLELYRVGKRGKEQKLDLGGVKLYQKKMKLGDGTTVVAEDGAIKVVSAGSTSNRTWLSRFTGVEDISYNLEMRTEGEGIVVDGKYIGTVGSGNTLAVADASYSGADTGEYQGVVSVDSKKNLNDTIKSSGEKYELGKAIGRDIVSRIFGEDATITNEDYNQALDSKPTTYSANVDGVGVSVYFKELGGGKYAVSVAYGDNTMKDYDFSDHYALRGADSQPAEETAEVDSGGEA